MFLTLRAPIKNHMQSQINSKCYLFWLFYKPHTIWIDQLMLLSIKMQYFLWSSLQFQSTTYIVTKLEHLHGLLLNWNIYKNFYWNGTHTRTSTGMEHIHELLLNWNVYTNFYWIGTSTGLESLLIQHLSVPLHK